MFHIIKAFLTGILEFRTDFTTNYDHLDSEAGDAQQEAYDHGRELAHKTTFRKWDNTEY